MSAARSAEAAVLALARQRPELGKVRAARELRRRGIRLSPSAVQLIWQRHGLASGYERLKVLQRQGGAAGALSRPQRELLDRLRIARHPPKRADASPLLGRERLIFAAARILGERGYEGASLAKICAAAGMLPGSLYHHFRSKQDLFIKVHGEGFRQLNEAVDSALARETDPWRRLEAACAAHLTLLVGSPDVSLVTGTSLFHTAPTALQRRLNRDRDAYEARYRVMISALPLPEGVDPTLLRLTLLGALNWTRMWYRPDKKSPREIAHHLVQRVLRHGLEARSPWQGSTSTSSPSPSRSTTSAA